MAFADPTDPTPTRDVLRRHHLSSQWRAIKRHWREVARLWRHAPLPQASVSTVTADHLEYLYHNIARADALNAAIDTKVYVALTAQTVIAAAVTAFLLNNGTHVLLMFQHVYQMRDVMGRSRLNAARVGQYLASIAFLLITIWTGIATIRVLTYSFFLVSTRRYRFGEETAGELLGLSYQVNQERVGVLEPSGIEVSPAAHMLFLRLSQMKRTDLCYDLTRMLMAAEVLYMRRGQRCDELSAWLRWESLGLLSWAVLATFFW